MESQVKERIVGAAVLVALGVWLIPWVLDGSDDSAPDSEPAPGLTLPGADDSVPARTESISLEPPSQRETAAEREIVAEEASSRESQPPAETTARTEGEPEAVEASAASDTAAPPAAATREPTPTPAVAAEPVARPAPAAGWMVQLGAFSDPAAARQVASGVSDYGYTAHVSELVDGSRTLHRVRIGGYETRAQADAVRSALMAHGYQPQVVSPE